MRYVPVKHGKRIIGSIESLSKLKKLPTSMQVLQRLQTLQKSNNGKSIFIAVSMTAREVEECWKLQDMPVQARGNIYRKICRLRNLKEVRENELFDVLPQNACFITAEERKYYETQKKLVGFCSSKLVPYQIHPAKRNINNVVSIEDTSFENEERSIPDENIEPDVASSSATSEDVTKPKPLVSCDLAMKIRNAANLSLSQTLKVLKVLHKEIGAEMFVAPSRAALWKACYKTSLLSKQFLPCMFKNNILTFDGKTYPNLYGCKRHVLAICYDERLIALRELNNKTAACVSNTILSVLSGSSLTPQVCISDTEPSNTGKKNGVFARLKNEFPCLTYEPCRLHLLDLILKHEMEARFKEFTTSPNLEFHFVRDIYLNWSKYKEKYNTLAVGEMPENYYSLLPKGPEKRSDYRLLLNLVLTLRYKREHGIYCSLSLPNKPPSICRARWNSRAIYAIMSELLSLDNDNIKALNTFIVEKWARAWFGARQYIDWNDLMKFNLCQKSRNVITRNIVNYDDPNPVTSEIAERVFRMTEEKIIHCKSMETLELEMIKYFNDSSQRLN